jgi:phosphoglycolate phosphatase
MKSQNNSAFKVVIFDLDGTLIDSIADIADCANTVLNNHGFPTLSEERFKELVGDGFANLTRKIIPPSELSAERVEQFTREYRELYRERWHQRTTVYQGIHELLRSLQSASYTLCVLSNKRDEYTKLCVARFFPDVRFAEIRGEQPGTPIKPAPDAALAIAASCGAKPEECVFVGDSEIDIETGKRAGMTAVGVLWGFRPRITLEHAGATALISHPHELLAFVSSEPAPSELCQDTCT